jgi:hypothetical protein
VAVLNHANLRQVYDLNPTSLDPPRSEPKQIPKMIAHDTPGLTIALVEAPVPSLEVGQFVYLSREPKSVGQHRELTITPA